MKAVIVIDMPRNCWGCPCNEVDSDGMSWCNALAKNTIHSNVERQSWCPLRPLPKRKDEGSVLKPLPFEVYMYRYGFNECLDAITGETE